MLLRDLSALQIPLKQKMQVLAENWALNLTNCYYNWYLNSPAKYKRCQADPHEKKGDKIYG